MKRCTHICVTFLLSLISFPLIAEQSHTSPEIRSTPRISFPDKTWAVEIDLPRFVADSAAPSANGDQALEAADRQTGETLHIDLRAYADGHDEIACETRFSDWTNRQSQTGMQYEEMQIGVLSVLKSQYPKTRGAKVARIEFQGCALVDGILVAVGLQKKDGNPTEGEVSEAFRGVKIVNLNEGPEALPVPVPQRPRSFADRQPQKMSEDFFREGSKLYIMEDYSGAIGPYQKALDLEKQSRDLPHTQWLVLIDNLGMAYGITGDLDHAQSVFEYGIRKEPKYPLFYYNLACTYAERKNMDRAMNFLKTAFDLKANLIPGETMPDPRSDDSFREFMKNKKFRDFVNSLVTAN